MRKEDQAWEEPIGQLTMVAATSTITRIKPDERISHIPVRGKLSYPLRVPPLASSHLT